MKTNHASTYSVVIAFAIVYIVWGSTYFFIKTALHSFPPFMLGFLRFAAAGLLMLVWCKIQKENLWNPRQIKTSLLVGFLLLFIGNGAVIVAEKVIPSSLAAVLTSSSPIWFILLDKPLWRVNFRSRETLVGLVIGFAGVLLLFHNQLTHMTIGSGGSFSVLALLLIVIGSIAWAGGSVYSKYHSSGSTVVNTTWQMIGASIAFLIVSLFTGEATTFQPAKVDQAGWIALVYLVLMGSIAGYSAYVWLLKVRPVTQVSTYAYVNPVVAVLLGYLFASESINATQIAGLFIILISILLTNLAKYRASEVKVS